MAVLLNKRSLRISMVVLATVLIVAGIMRYEVIDVIMNAKILCLSCIGLK
ncbi:hypothetical protein ACFL47_09410 [Candidatus Latescibacterota bacterium]